jgi:peptide/nickel transport system substrate-binding protein
MIGIGTVGMAGAALSGSPVLAQSHKGTLVLAIDFADTVTFDPAHQSNYVAPLICAACYECLVTMTPDDYVNVKPALATSWQRTPDGTGWRFTLRQGVKFSSGAVMTADDVKYSLDRVLYVGDQPSQYLSNVVRFDKVDDKTIDVILKNPAEPILTILAAPSFVVGEKKVMEEHGSDASKDAKANDRALAWLNQNSVGTAPYRLTRWEQNSQIQLVANPYYWRGKPPFDRIVIRHIPDSAVQLLSLQRGDIDAAFNLIPEQVATLKDNKDIWIDSLISTDFVYLALTSEASFNKALSVNAARRAVGYAIDYDGIINLLLAGHAVRPVTFLPVGTNGSTEELTREIGYRQDLEKSKKLLAEAGFPDGFEFDLQYGNGAVTGTSFQVLAQKLQSDLARVGIKAKLAPLDQVTFRTNYTTFKATSALSGRDGGARRETRALGAPGRRRKAGPSGGVRDRQTKTNRVMETISADHGGSGQSVRAVPADLSDWRAPLGQSFPADRGRLAGRDVWRATRVSSRDAGGPVSGPPVECRLNDLHQLL